MTAADRDRVTVLIDQAKCVFVEPFEHTDIASTIGIHTVDIQLYLVSHYLLQLCLGGTLVLFRHQRYSGTSPTL